MINNYSLSVYQHDGGWFFAWGMDVDGKSVLLYADNQIHTSIDCCYRAGRTWMDTCGPRDIVEFIQEGLHRENSSIH